MDPSPITFTGTPIEQDVVDMYRYCSLCVMRPFFRWLIGLFSTLIAAVSVTAMLVFHQFSLQVCLISGLFVYFPLAWWYHDRFTARRHYRKHPELYGEGTVTITERDMSLSNRNCDLRLNWNQLAFLLNTPKGLLFMIPPMRAFCWLPQRSFEGNDQKAGILEYAARNNILVRTMN